MYEIPCALCGLCGESPCAGRSTLRDRLDAKEGAVSVQRSKEYGLEVARRAFLSGIRNPGSVVEDPARPVAQGFDPTV